MSPRGGVALVAIVVSSTALHAQSIASRVAAAPKNNAVRFEFQPREGVCGNGRMIIQVRPGEENVSVTRMDESGRYNGRVDHRTRAEWLSECDGNPARVELQLRNGQPTRVDLAVGGAWSDRDNATDLGTVAGDAAAEYLISVAANAVLPRDEATDALFAATITPARTQVASGLLAFARNMNLDSELRSSAVFWLGQEAADKATAGLKSILGDDNEEIQVRETAIFVISQKKDAEAVSTLMDIAQHNREPELRRTAMFWLARHSDDPRVLRFFQDILTK